MDFLKKYAAVLAAGLCLNAFIATAQETWTETAETETWRPVTSAYVLRAGGAHVADTYLTPVIYDGWNVGFDYTRMQAMKFSPEKWVMQLRIAADGGRTKNPPGNAIMWNADITADWSMMRRWTPLPHFTVGVGGYTGINGGVIYLSRNGNNPASAKADWHLGVTAYATYKLKLWKFQTLLRWQGSMPLLGAFFSPAYGELYYEIWLGNHSGLAHFAWPGNFRQIDNEISVDINMGTTWLRLGYRSHVLSTRVNDITSRLITNSAVVGITTEWISLRPDRLPGKQARIISALY